MQLYLVEHFNRSTKNHEIDGVFSTERHAIDVCTTADHYYIPLTLDKSIADDVIENIVGVNVFFPRRTTSSEEVEPWV